MLASRENQGKLLVKFVNVMLVLGTQVSLFGEGKGLAPKESRLSAVWKKVCQIHCRIRETLFPPLVGFLAVISLFLSITDHQVDTAT